MRALTVTFFLALSFQVSAQCYTVAPVSYYPDTSQVNQQTTVVVLDDQWSVPIHMGFTFCFYGAQYDSIVVGTNGILSFETANALQYCMWPIAMPIPTGTAPTNAIMLPWADLSVNTGDSIHWWISGTTPNRTFTVKYDSLRMYGCPQSWYSARAILHESSYEIEIQLDSKDFCSWNTSRAILGIHNQTGQMATVVQGRNATNWTASQEGWLFSPACNVCSGVGVDEPLTDSAWLAVYPNPSLGITTVALSGSHRAVSTIEVTDIAGRTVQKFSVTLSGGEHYQFYIDEPGIYLIRTYSETETLISTKKLVVE